MHRSALLTGLVSVALLIPTPHASAHPLSRSFSRWTINNSEVTVTAVIPLREVLRRRKDAMGKSLHQIVADPKLGVFLSDHIPSRLQLVDKAAACTRAGKAILRTVSPDRIEIHWRLQCKRTPAPAIRSELFMEPGVGHMHFARIRAGNRELDGALSRELRVLEPDHPDATARPQFLVEGLMHVALGLDHIAFIIGLVLLGGGFWTLLKVITGFTIGHSITLGLATTGIVSPNPSGVELLVAISIAYVALSCFVSRVEQRTLLKANLGLHAMLAAILLSTSTAAMPVGVVAASALFTSCHLMLHREQGATPTLRATLAILFGLVHGFAFAGAVGDLFSGVELGLPLLTFNLGVELGQIMVVVAATPVLVLLKRRLTEERFTWTTTAIAAMLLAAGVQWAALRALG